jgi:hypothetical protein
MRSDLGRLDAIAEILQVGPFLGPNPEKWKTDFRKRSCPNKKISDEADVAKLDQTLARKSGALGVAVCAVVYCPENAGSIP